MEAAAGGVTAAMDRARGFVLRVAARIGNLDGEQRQADCLGLRRQQVPADGMHRHAVECLVHRRQQAHHLDVGLLAKDVQRPGGVFPGGPGEEGACRP